MQSRFPVFTIAAVLVTAQLGGIYVAFHLFDPAECGERVVGLGDQVDDLRALVRELAEKRMANTLRDIDHDKTER